MASREQETQTDLVMRARLVILAVAALGWFFGGMQIAITNVAMRSAALDLLNRDGEIQLEEHQRLSTATERTPEEEQRLLDWNGLAGRWYAFFQCAFLFGAAVGGYVFGRLGDRVGRTRALAASVIWFGGFSAVAYLSAAPWQLLLFRFLACVGIGGTWPNGVALVSEAWSSVARPIMASLIGMAGNVGIFAMGTLATHVAITPDSWRWVMLVGSVPILLGLIVLVAVPESPQWLSRRRVDDGLADAGGPSRWTVFTGKYLRITLVGIGLATIPLIGGWGSANWMIPWAGEVGAATGDDFLKAKVVQARSLTSILGSALAGVIACGIGRRRTYFLTSLGALLAAQYAFWATTPGSADFLWMVAILGFFNGVFFGWLPFFLPELFGTRVRATGAGVSFNFGRILTAFTIFVTGATMQSWIGGYPEIGRLTSLVFALGLILIWMAPDVTRKVDQEDVAA